MTRRPDEIVSCINFGCKNKYPFKYGESGFEGECPSCIKKFKDKMMEKVNTNKQENYDAAVIERAKNFYVENYSNFISKADAVAQISKRFGIVNEVTFAILKRKAFSEELKQVLTEKRVANRKMNIELKKSSSNR